MMMMYRLSFTSLVLLVGAAPGAVAKYHDLDMNRDPDIFGTPDFVAGTTYTVTVALDQVSTMEILETKYDTVVQTEGTQELTVSARAEGGKEIDTVMTHFMMHMEMMGFATDFDSDHMDDAPTEFSSFSDLIGVKTTVVIDDDGNLVEVKDTPKLQDENNVDESAEFVQEVQEAKEENNGTATPFDSSSQYQLMTRLNKALPESPVKPGDSWEVISDMNGLGSITGTATLSGYRSYKHYDVAVIHLDGKLEINLSAVSSLLGTSDATHGATFQDAEIKSLMFWDNTANLMRWSQSNQTMVMEIPNPMDEDTTLKIPLSQTITVTIDEAE